jgi:hypothetical protein
MHRAGLLPKAYRRFCRHGVFLSATKGNVMTELENPIRRAPKSRIASAPPVLPVFQIRPLVSGRGFELSGKGLLRDSALHSRLIDAIVQAAQIGRHLEGAIQIFDRSGEVAAVLPLPNAH